MLKIKEYDLESLNANLDTKIKKIDDLIKTDLKKLSTIDVVKPFFTDLLKIVDFDSDFSFIKAPLSIIGKLKEINTKIKICNIKQFNSKLSLPKSSFAQKEITADFTFNNIIEHIFGYHLESRTQILKKIFRQINSQNCVYCLAQYTTSYSVNNGKIYVKGNLDHIHPKSINALVSLSVNNLVPVCAHCNQRKLDADSSKFNFNPFDSEDTPVFKFKNVITISNGDVQFKDIQDLKIDNINPTLEKRLELTSLYKEYRSPIENLLERYRKFNSSSYKEQIQKLSKNGISDNLEYFISETPYTDGNIQNIPLHKFKSDFYRELEEYKKSGEIKLS